MSPTDVVSTFLQNTAPDTIEAAAERFVATSTFIRIARYWTIEEFRIDALFGAAEDVAVFGAFTYRSNTVGKSFRSPFSIHAKVRNEKIVYFQFMEDTFASGRSFSSGGSWTIKTDPNGPEYQV